MLNQPHQCRLSDYDRRTLKDGFRVGELVSVQGVDYFENLCLQSEYTMKDLLPIVIVSKLYIE